MKLILTLVIFLLTICVPARSSAKTDESLSPAPATTWTVYQLEQFPTFRPALSRAGTIGIGAAVGALVAIPLGILVGNAVGPDCEVEECDGGDFSGLFLGTVAGVASLVAGSVAGPIARRIRYRAHDVTAPEVGFDLFESKNTELHGLELSMFPFFAVGFNKQLNLAIVYSRALSGRIGLSTKANAWAYRLGRGIFERGVSASIGPELFFRNNGLNSGFIAIRVGGAYFSSDEWTSYRGSKADCCSDKQLGGMVAAGELGRRWVTKFGVTISMTTGVDWGSRIVPTILGPLAEGDPGLGVGIAPFADFQMGYAW